MSKRYKQKNSAKGPSAAQPAARLQVEQPQATQEQAGQRPRQSRDQRLSRAALDCVKAAAGGPLASDYKPRAMSFPIQVLQAGLAQAVGFLAAKSGTSNNKAEAYALYFEHLAKVAGLQSGSVLLENSLKSDLAAYRLLTRDVLDAAAWLKRCSQSVLIGDTKEIGHGT